MKVSVERLPESQLRLDIAADDAEFAEAMERAYRTVGRDVQIPGFRKGKVPRHMIERMFGRAIFLEEAHRGLMDTLYRDALKQEDIVPVGDPEVELLAAEPLQFTVTVSVFPTVEPGDYLSVRAEPADASIEEGSIDAVLTRLRDRVSPWVEVTEPRTPIEGDRVTVDLAMTGEDGEPFQDPVEDSVFIIGESQLFDGLRTAIESLHVGETTDTTIAFDEDDDDVVERLRGAQLTYTITLKKIEERQLLEIDDAFAVEHGGAENLEALRIAVRDDLHAGKTSEARNEVLNGIIGQIAEGAGIEVPAPMIDDAVTEELGRVRQRLSYQRTTLEAYLRVQNQTEDDLRAELRPAVAQRLRNSLVLREIAEREGIEVTDADLEAEIEDLMLASPDPEQARKVYGDDRYMRGVLRNDLFDRRLSDRLIEIATEGRGAVVNGWVAPAPAARPEPDAAGETDQGDEPGASSEDERTAAMTGAGSADETAMGIAAAPAAAEATEDVDAPNTGITGSVGPDDNGDCPAGYPIKGNLSSHIYHAPGTRSFNATAPEICFATAEDAVAAGYRAPLGASPDVAADAEAAR